MRGLSDHASHGARTMRQLTVHLARLCAYSQLDDLLFACLHLSQRFLPPLGICPIHYILVVFSRFVQPVFAAYFLIDEEAFVYGEEEGSVV